MKMTNIKKLFLKALIMGTITFGALNIVPYEVQASSYETIDINALPYDRQELIKKYSSIFGIRIDFVCDMLHTYVDDIDDFTVIDGVEYENEEEAICTFIYRLAYKPEKYGLSKKDVQRIDYGYEMDLSHEESIYYYSKLMDIDPEIALSISYAECGTDLSSSNYNNNNNPAGIGPYMKFGNKEEGIIYYVFLLKNGYKLSENADDKFFKCIAKTYCPDNPDHWISLSKGIYSDVQGDYFIYNPDLKEEYEDKGYTNDSEDDINYDIIEKLDTENSSNRFPKIKKKSK